MSGPMKDGGFEMDFSNFNKKFFEYALTAAPDAAEKGMFEAISELKNDADNVTPKTPHDEGNLRGDYTIVLEGITESKIVEHSEGKNPNHHKGGSKPAERFGAKDIITKLILRMPYAAKWHEAVNKKVNWSEGGVGPKYLETKMMMFMKKYFGIVASRIKKATGG
jgi:hypothetical protein